MIEEYIVLWSLWKYIESSKYMSFASNILSCRRHKICKRNSFFTFSQLIILMITTLQRCGICRKMFVVTIETNTNDIQLKWFLQSSEGVKKIIDNVYNILKNWLLYSFRDSFLCFCVRRFLSLSLSLSLSFSMYDSLRWPQCIIHISRVYKYFK